MKEDSKPNFSQRKTLQRGVITARLSINYKDVIIDHITLAIHTGQSATQLID